MPLHRHIHPKASAPPEADQAPRYTLDFRSSDQTLDRYQEIITAAGWQLDNYRKNPVVQNAHNYWSLADTIGRSLITEVRGDHLFQRVQFAVEENPMARLAYGLYKGGFLNAVSVGFIPLRWDNGSPEAGYHRKYLEQELLEVSAVSIPANPNALTLGLKAGAIEKTDLRELMQLLRDVCGETKTFTEANKGNEAEPRRTSSLSSLSSVQIPLTDTPQLLHLRKQLEDIRALLRRA